MNLNKIVSILTAWLIIFSPLSKAAADVSLGNFDVFYNYSNLNPTIPPVVVTPPTPGSGVWQLAGWTGGGCYPDVEFDPANDKRVYLTSDVGGLWRSEDLGESWVFKTKGLGNLMVAGIAVANSDPNTVYAATEGGIYVSHDAGENWAGTNRNGNEITFARPDNHKTIAILSSNRDVLAVGTNKGAIFYSQNAGVTWSTLANNKTPFGNTSAIAALRMTKDGSALYAASNSGGVMKYTFSSGSWQKLNGVPNSARDLLISPTDDKTIYVGGASTLYISKDSGATWTQSANIGRGVVTRISEGFDGRILSVTWEAGWDGGVVTSTNKGQSWSSGDNMIPDLVRDPTRSWSRSGGAKVVTIGISPWNSNVILRTDWWGVWRSDDGGASWKEKLNGVPNTVGSDVYAAGDGEIYVATMDNGLLSSANKGDTYTMRFPTVYRDDLSGHVWRVVVSNDGKRIVGTSSPWNQNVNQVIVSEDSGKTFTTVRTGLPASRPKVNTVWGEGYPRALAADPTNFNRILMGIDGDDGGGLFISNDGGKTWNRSAGQPAGKRIYNGLVIDPTNPQRIYWGATGNGGGVYRSEDGGATWKYVFSQISWVFDMAIGGDGTVYATGDYSGTPRVYASKDNGNTWNVVGSFTTAGAGEGIAVDPKDPKVIAVSAHQWTNYPGGKIFLTRDGGSNWTEITDDLPPGTGAAAMAFSKVDNTLYMSRYAGSVYRRTY